MTFKNAKRFKGKISKLPATVAKACREAMEEVAQDIVDHMRDLVPVETGTLRDSIDWCWGKPPADAKLFTSIARGRRPDATDADNRISIFAGSFEAYYARWVEFGTKARVGRYRDASGRKRNAGKRGHAATPAHPFFFPVWRAHKRRLRGVITRRVNAAIKKLAQSNGN